MRVGFNYEIYVNGRLVTRDAQDRWPAHYKQITGEFSKEKDYEMLGDNTFNIFRWGMYMGSRKVVNDGLVLWSGVEIDGDARLAPPTCEWTSAGFMLPELVPGLGSEFKATFSMTLQSHNTGASRRSNIFWLGKPGAKVLAAWLDGNTDSTAKLWVEWGEGGKDFVCGSSRAVKLGTKIDVVIQVSESAGVNVLMDGVRVCHGRHPGPEGFGASKTPNPLYLSVPDEETADVCMSSIRWESSPQPDPNCCGGVSGGRACCAASCGKCGGDGCKTRKGGYDKCCGGGVKKLGVSCDKDAAPCLMSKSRRSGVCPATTTAPKKQPSKTAASCFDSDIPEDTKSTSK